MTQIVGLLTTLALGLFAGLILTFVRAHARANQKTHFEWVRKETYYVAALIVGIYGAFGTATNLLAPALSKWPLYLLWIAVNLIILNGVAFGVVWLYVHDGSRLDLFSGRRKRDVVRAIGCSLGAVMFLLCELVAFADKPSGFGLHGMPVVVMSTTLLLVTLATMGNRKIRVRVSSRR